MLPVKLKSPCLLTFYAEMLLALIKYGVYGFRTKVTFSVARCCCDHTIIQNHLGNHSLILPVWIFHKYNLWFLEQDFHKKMFYKRFSVRTDT